MARAHSDPTEPVAPAALSSRPRASAREPGPRAKMRTSVPQSWVPDIALTLGTSPRAGAQFRDDTDARRSESARDTAIGCVPRRRQYSHPRLCVAILRSGLGRGRLHHAALAHHAGDLVEDGGIVDGGRHPPLLAVGDLAHGAAQDFARAGL